MNDNYLMPFGKYEGKALVNVSASYLLYIYENFPNLSSKLRKYIEENMDVLQEELK